MRSCRSRRITGVGCSRGLGGRGGCLGRLGWGWEMAGMAVMVVMVEAGVGGLL